MKKILVTGVLGRDGYNMCEFLLKDPDNRVFGMIRRVSNPNYVNCQSFLDNPNFQIVYGDLGDEFSIGKLVHEIQPDFFINLAANSFVACSWDMPQQVMDTNAIGVLRCLEAIKSYQPNCRFYSAGSSEEFGNIDYAPQDMKHPMKPRSPYGVSKCAAHHLVKVYRESYDMYAVHGVLFNHEGTKRGEEFVTRKIILGLIKIIKNDLECLELGNLNAKRDWGYAKEYVEAMWKMLQQKEPKDYIIATGKTNKLEKFVDIAFSIKKLNWEKYVVQKNRHHIKLYSSTF